MNFSAYILHTNRPDLCLKAALSLRGINADTIVIDNSDNGLELPGADWVSIYKPSVPLTAPQSFNFALAKARARGEEFILTMHEDAEAVDGSASVLAARAMDLNLRRHRWGVLFTHYDALAAYNLSMLFEVGLWDTNFHHYFSDNDYFRRVKMAGYECIDTGLPVNHLGSQTIHSDPRRKFMNSILFPMDAEYYRRKHGGDPGKETFERMFNL